MKYLKIAVCQNLLENWSRIRKITHSICSLYAFSVLFALNFNIQSSGFSVTSRFQSVRYWSIAIFGVFWQYCGTYRAFFAVLRCLELLMPPSIFEHILAPKGGNCVYHWVASCIACIRAKITERIQSFLNQFNHCNLVTLFYPYCIFR